MPNDCFSQIYVFGGCRIAVFFIFGCSAPAEQAFFLKPTVPEVGNEAYFYNPSRILLERHY